MPAPLNVQVPPSPLSLLDMISCICPANAFAPASPDLRMISPPGLPLPVLSPAFMVTSPPELPRSILPLFVPPLPALSVREPPLRAEMLAPTALFSPNFLPGSRKGV